MRRRINELINLINEEAGIDIFRNTRKREYVEARAVLTYFLREYFHLRLSDIQNIFHKNGYQIHHATLIHALKCFNDTYLPHNVQLQAIHSAALEKLNCKTEFKIRHLQDKIQDLPEDKLDEVKKMIEELTV